VQVDDCIRACTAFAFLDICSPSKITHPGQMDVFLEILKYTFPALLMLLLTYLILSNFVDNEEKRRAYSLRKNSQKNALPLRLQAIERITLFLERITPSSLLVRHSSVGLTVKQYQAILLKAIRDEFEYNLSQQVYVSEEAWRMVVTAKSATVSIINNIAAKLPADTAGLELSKKVLEDTMDMNQFPTRTAINYLKKEIQSDF
jgi:hypothetical protein